MRYKKKLIALIGIIVIFLSSTLPIYAVEDMHHPASESEFIDLFKDKTVQRDTDYNIGFDKYPGSHEALLDAIDVITESLTGIDSAYFSSLYLNPVQNSYYNADVAYHATLEEEQETYNKIKDLNLTNFDNIVNKIRYISNNLNDYDNPYKKGQSAYSLLIKNRAVCAGHAALMYKMIKYANSKGKNYKVNIVEGQMIEADRNSGGPHAWNKVTDGEGNTYYIDLLNDLEFDVYSKQDLLDGNVRDDGVNAYVIGVGDPNFNYNNYVYKNTANGEYTVKFKDYNDNILATQNVNEGGDATPPANKPTRESYIFVGWDDVYSNILSNKTVNAQYKVDPNADMYKITFKNKYNEIIDTKYVKKGGSVEPPEHPVVNNYIPDGWDKDLTNITSDMMVTAKYKLKEYTVQYLTFTDKVAGIYKVKHGEDAPKSSIPTRKGYIFTEWEGSRFNITSDTTIRPKFRKNTSFEDKHVVTFLDYDGIVLEVKLVDDGNSVEPPMGSVRDGYNFVGWDRELNNVEGDLIVTAKFEEDLDKETYNITFEDFDGKVLKTDEVLEGDKAIAPEEPTREGYIFVGWGSSLASISYNQTFTARYVDLETETHQVTFLDYNNEVIYVQTVEDGGYVYSPYVPDKNGYELKGWSGGPFNPVYEDITLEAVYEDEMIDHYIITFKDGNGNIIEDRFAKDGDPLPELDESRIPKKEGKDFIGWDTDVTSVTEDLTLTPQYGIEEYIIEFIGLNDKEIETRTKLYNEDLGDYPEVPLEEGYDFLKWDKNITKVTTSGAITAKYKPKEYIVRFKDEDENIIDEQTVRYGKSALLPEWSEVPDKEGYEVTGWDGSYENVTEDIVLKPVYEKKKYAVFFRDKENGIVQTGMYEHGISVKAPDIPEREGYNIIGWDKETTNITKDINVYPEYEKKTYNVIFKKSKESDEILAAETVKYKESPKEPDIPKKENLVFNGWSKDISEVTKDMIVYPTYTDITYDVTFKGKDNKVIAIYPVPHGGSTQGPDVEDKKGFIFDKWDGDLENITSDTTFTAIYKKVEESNTENNEIDESDSNSNTKEDLATYEVMFVNHNKEEIETVTVEEGSSATPPDEPKRDGYEFKSWDKSFDNVTSNMIITAEYEEISGLTYEVTFLDDNGYEIETVKVNKGEDADEPRDPEKDGYKFIGWDEELDNVKKDITTKPIFEKAFTVRFEDYDGDILDIDMVLEGEDAHPPRDPRRSGYEFDEWDTSYRNIYEDTIIEAEYDRKKYEGDYKDTVDKIKNSDVMENVYDEIEDLIDDGDIDEDDYDDLRDDIESSIKIKYDDDEDRVEDIVQLMFKDLDFEEQLELEKNLIKLEDEELKEEFREIFEDQELEIDSRSDLEDILESDDLKKEEISKIITEKVDNSLINEDLRDRRSKKRVSNAIESTYEVKERYDFINFIRAQTYVNHISNSDLKYELSNQLNGLNSMNSRFKLEGFEDNEEPNIVINSNKLNFTLGNESVKPYVKNGRTLTSVREIGNALGAKVFWNSSTQTVTLLKKDRDFDYIVEMQIDNNRYYVNGIPKYLNVVPEVKNGRSYFPVRSIAEAFGSTVLWNEEYNTIFID